MEYYIKESKKNVWWLCLVFHRGKRSIESGGHATWKLIFICDFASQSCKGCSSSQKGYGSVHPNFNGEQKMMFYLCSLMT